MPGILFILTAAVFVTVGFRAEAQPANTTNTVPAAIADLVKAIKNESWPSPVSDATGGFVGAWMATEQWKADVRSNFKTFVNNIQTQHLEETAAKAILAVVQEEWSFIQNRIRNKQPYALSIQKAICFKATGALGMLASTSPIALQTLRQLKDHPDPVTSSDAAIWLDEIAVWQKANERAPNKASEPSVAPAPQVQR